HMGLQVLAPDVNQSFAEFAVVPDTNQIRFGMNAVKNVGTNAVEEILRARKEGGEFASLEDFLKRVNVRIVNRKNLESLVKAGGFDSMGDRSELLFNLDNMLAYAVKVQKDAAEGQTDLFGNLLDEMIAPLALEKSPNQIGDHEMLQWERELLGLYLSSHPLDKYDAYFTEQTMPIGNLTKEMDNKVATVGGVVMDSRSIVTKSGSKMAFVKLEDKSGEMEIIVFPKLFEEVGDKLAQDTVLKIKGKLNAKDRDGRIMDDLKIIADDITVVTPEELTNYKATGKSMKSPKASAKSLATDVGGVKVTYKPVDELRAPAPQPEPEEIKPRLYVHVKNPDDHDSLLKLKQTFNNFPGAHEVVLVLGLDKKSAMRMPFKIEPAEDLQTSIAGLLGPDCVALK
ncbi:MAG TPA: OB-fold nucleic acid binding domain-containing protein, partial [Candidatus Saccharimonadales bacterium]|nr:OB-fold nucleic acid binding domain-containing protein [Candidatus Saccharimonadales bacterium]